MIILSGVAFFMFGMTIASEALQKIAANRVRDLLLKLSDNNFLGVLVGVTLAVLLQSSGAVTSMLVGLGSARVITLAQVMGVIIGSAIGTTVTVQLISFNIAQYGLPIFTVGFIFYFLTNKRMLKNSMAVVMGFGMIFLGIEMTSQGSLAFSQLPFFGEVFKTLSENPLLSLVVSAIFCAVVQSSAVTVGLAMGLCNSGVITMHDALYWVYGANIGTTSVALLASVGGNYVGRQVAWAHFFYKAVTVALCFVLTEPLLSILPLVDADISRQIANAHTLLNVAGAILFFPFIRWGARWIETIVTPAEGEREFSSQFLNDSTYQSRTLVLAHANREILRMGDIVLSMIKDGVAIFRNDDQELIDSIRKRDDQVDLLTKEINMFLVRHSRESDDGVNGQVFDLITYASDLEAAADVIDNSMVHLASKMHALKVNFSDSGWCEIEEMQNEIVRIVSLSMTCFQLKDRALAEEVLTAKRKLRNRDRDLKAAHIGRLNQGLAATINTSSIHLDLLGDFRRIVGLMTNHCYNYIREEAAAPSRRAES
jgi:phosphate:Na+ symporter